MKFPPHPGEIVREELSELGISVAEAARAFGVTRQQLYNVIASKSRVSAEMAVRLEKGLGSTAEFWLRLQAAYDVAQVLNRGDILNVVPLVQRQAE